MDFKTTTGITLSLCMGLLLAIGCSTRGKGPGVIDPDAPSEFTTTDSGLKYRILRKSSGAKPSANSRVTVDYSGWLDNGTVFDSSYDRPDPATFALGAVIAGWTEGIQYVGEGGMIELEIPSELGYGRNGFPPNIPPNSRLHFKVELIRIE